MSERKDGRAAFPIIEQFGTEQVCTHHGMSLRDWYAGQAICGILAGVIGNPGIHMDTNRDVKTAFEIADAMIEARGEGG